jgi:hypothetical protein
VTVGLDGGIHVTKEEKLHWMHVVRSEGCMWSAWLDMYVTEDSQRALMAPKMNGRIAELDRMIEEEKKKIVA